MQKVQEGKILDTLERHLDYVMALGYNAEGVVGAFLYGSQNYNLANANSDVDSKVIVIPTFKDFCTTPEMISREYTYNKREHIDVKDLRIMRQQYLKQNINFIETLYTRYFILNPKYEDLFNEYFINNRDMISHCNRQQTLRSVSGQLTHTLDEGEPTLDNKKLANACRLYIFLKRYFDGMPYRRCLELEGADQIALYDLKFGLSRFSEDSVRKQKTYDQLRVAARTINGKYRNVHSTQKEEAELLLDEGTVEIIKTSFNLDDKLKKENFINHLTIPEKKAYNAIAERIGAEGGVGISDLMHELGYGRSVFNSFLKKLHDYDMGESRSMGHAGTYIQMINPELKADANKIRRKAREKNNENV